MFPAPLDKKGGAFFKTTTMSVQVPDCLENIIGLSRSECECFSDGKPIDANSSLSGLMIDELKGLNLSIVSGAEGCEGGLWEMMDSARSEAIKQFTSDFYGDLLNKYRLKRKPFSGEMGQTRYKNTLTNVTSPYAGVPVRMNNIRGGIWRIKRIGTAFTQTGSFTLTLFNDLQDDSIESFVLQTEANKVKWNAISTPIYLPMESGGTGIRYDFLYQPSMAPGLPKDNGISCGCGGYKPVFNLQSPKFRPMNTAASGWEMFAMVGSMQGTSVATGNDRDSFTFGHQYLNGIILDVEFLCDFSGILCSTVTDFVNNPLAGAVAGAIRYLACVFLIDDVLASGNINYFTMTDRERLMQKKSSYASEYNMRLKEVIIPAINIDHNDCLMCNNDNAPRKVGILS